MVETDISKITPKFWSNLFDALIVIADLLVGNLVSPVFMSIYSNAAAVSNRNTLFLCVIILLLTAMYAAGLLINKVNFRAEKNIRLSGADGIALLFNLVLLAGIFPLIVIELFPIAMNIAVVIILSFGFMAGWAWLHGYILKKVSPESGEKPSIKRKIIGFVLVFPFVTGLSVPIGVLSEKMNLYAGGEAVTLANALLYPLFAGLLLALLAWFLYFIPRKMLKGFMGANIRSRYFFLALALDYTFTLSSINFLR